jgi:hypothetical protein
MSIVCPSEDKKEAARGGIARREDRALMLAGVQSIILASIHKQD